MIAARRTVSSLGRWSKVVKSSSLCQSVFSDVVMSRSGNVAIAVVPAVKEKCVYLRCPAEGQDGQRVGVGQKIISGTLFTADYRKSAKKSHLATSKSRDDAWRGLMKSPVFAQGDHWLSESEFASSNLKSKIKQQDGKLPTKICGCNICCLQELIFWSTKEIPVFTGDIPGGDSHVNHKDEGHHQQSPRVQSCSGKKTRNRLYISEIHNVELSGSVKGIRRILVKGRHGQRKGICSSRANM